MTRVTADTRQPSKSRGHLFNLAVAYIGLVIITTGFRTVDKGFPAYFVHVLRVEQSELNPHQGFMFEGLLGDAIAYLTANVTSSPGLSIWSWFLIGWGASFYALALGVRNGSFNWPSVLIVFSIAHWSDTLLWIGKTDSLLLACLILSANKNRYLSLAGLVVAPFFHPYLSVITAIGIAIASRLDKENVEVWPILISLVSCVIDLSLFHLTFPEFTGRSGYFLSDAPAILVSGLDWGIPSFIADVAFPIAALIILTPFPISFPRRHISEILVWTLATGVLTSFLVLDHTRDATILITPVCLIYLRAINFNIDKFQNKSDLIIMMLMLGLVFPGYDATGPKTFYWTSARTFGCTLLDSIQTRHAAWIRPERCP